jgi:hypothetical protein
MLNLFRLESKRKTEQKTINQQEWCSKHFPVSTREWNNSIYVYNKNALNIIPTVAVSSIKLIKGYFNLYNNKLERRIRNDRLLRRLRKLSSHKIYVSNSQFKHTNNKVVISLYLFNRQRINFIKKFIKSRFISKGLTNLNNVLKFVKIRGMVSLCKANRKKIILTKLFKPYKKEVLSYKGLSKYITRFYKKLIRKFLTKVKLYIYYRQLLFINKSKFNYTYLQHVKKYLERLYNKNVEFNLINLRRFYLNSNILSESLTLKIRKNRRNLLKKLNRIKRKVKVQDKKSIFYESFLNKLQTRSAYINNKPLDRVVFSNIKHKHISGFRLQASGRLTRRYTASKSISKLTYKGNLLNVDSSYRGLSSVILKGNLKSNVEYTKSKSKTRIGSFGIKG